MISNANWQLIQNITAVISIVGFIASVVKNIIAKNKMNTSYWTFWEIYKVSKERLDLINSDNSIKIPIEDYKGLIRNYCSLSAIGLKNLKKKTEVIGDYGLGPLGISRKVYQFLLITRIGLSNPWVQIVSATV